MSEFMQIDIRLEPVYGSGGFSNRFPHMAKFFRDYNYFRVLEQEPSLYQLVEVLTMIRKDPAIPEGAKVVIVRMEGQFTKVRDEAREQLLGRRLNELDKTLYRLEDLFKDLERQLG